MISLTSPVETLWHRWPAGLKLALLCVATMLLFAAQRIEHQVFALAAVLGLYAIAGRAFLGAGLRSLRVLWPFLAVIAIWHIATRTYAEGAVVSLRLLSAFGLANLVTMTTRLSDMIAVVRALLTPFRAFGLQTRPLEIAIALVVRFTPVLMRKGGDLHDAWRARSVKRPGWRIVIPLTVLAIDDAEHVAEALRARGGVTETKKG